MAALKRRRSFEDNEDSDDFVEGSSQNSASEDEVDISSALTGKKKTKYATIEEDGNVSDEGDFEELEDLIRQSVAKRDKKEGTKLLKKTKGKTNITKGEVGGGSFQSMGMCKLFAVSQSLIAVYQVCIPQSFDL